MPTIVNLQEIKAIINQIDIVQAMKDGFIQYSRGNAIVPPVGELIFRDPPGDVHIKYGYIKQQEFYVIKIASGFYNNEELGIPSGQGLMLVFKQHTGELEAILLDEGYLTNIRTVAAGVLAIQHFSSHDNNIIGIIGTGTIAKLQIELIQKNNLGTTFYLWGRSLNKAEELKAILGNNIDIQIARSAKEVAKKANVIVTTTPSESALLASEDIQKGTLIVAIGSDTEHKQELDSRILANANLVVADSIAQSGSRGEIYKAITAGLITNDKVVEFGHLLREEYPQEDDQIIVVDLTGVAVQDIMVASAVYSMINK